MDVIQVSRTSLCLLHPAKRDRCRCRGVSGLPRFRAHELHQRVWDYLRQHFRDPAPWFDDLPGTLTTHPSFDRELIAARLAKLDRVFDLLLPVHQKQIFRQLVDRVTVGPDYFVVRVTIHGLIDLIFELLDEKDLDVMRARISEAQKANEE